MDVNPVTAGSSKRLMILRFLLLAGIFCNLVAAHQQPTTTMLLSVGSGQVQMTLHVPLNELELAFGHNVTQNPERTLVVWGGAFSRYLAGHVRFTTPEGRAWTGRVQEMTISKATQTQSGPFQEVVVQLLLAPPRAAESRNFILDCDLILHQVVTHRILVAVQSDWAGGRTEPIHVGTIAVNTTTSRIEFMPIQLGKGSEWTGMKAMILLGMQHIREGTDHLLFLVVLLLPATLLVQGREWGGFGGTDYSLRHLLRLVTAFTLGHSATLLAGAQHWLILPQQPVEVLIAISILVTAIHAVHPLFPGREAQVAAGFGLVHGLAFATVLTALNLTGRQMALSILGFNLGIELMQLLVVAFTIPWLILLNLTPAHRWVRIGGAMFAGIAAIGWIANRVSGQSNAIERAMNTVTRVSPLGILILAVIAISSYIFQAVANNSEREQIQ